VTLRELPDFPALQQCLEYRNTINNDRLDALSIQHMIQQRRYRLGTKQKSTLFALNVVRS